MINRITIPFIFLCLTISLHPLRIPAGEAGVPPVDPFARKAIQQERYAPVEMVQVGPGHYFIDFGKAYFGGLELAISKPEDGKKMVVHMGEAISAPKKVNRNPGASIRYRSSEVILKNEQKVYTVRGNDARLMPREIGAVMPFRYVELENAPPLEAGNVRQIAAFYPFSMEAASFTCSNPKINAIWELCRHTMKATSFGGVFVDGDRERLPYEADAYINQLGWYYTTDDLALPRHSHEHLIMHPTWPTEWIMFSVLMAWEDYQYTGDTASLRKYYADLRAKTLISLEREDGLISTVMPPVPQKVKQAIHFNNSIRDIVDWPPPERDGYEMKPVNTVVNAFHCHSLKLMANLAAVLKNTEDESLFRTAYTNTLRSLNAKLRDPASGLYIDGEGSKHRSLHANMFPLVFGLVPADRRTNVAEFVRSRGMACSVYGAQFLIDALFDNGMAAEAMDLMTADNDRSWTHMINVGTTITLEAWDKKYKGNLDWNHAWGAAPANILPRKILGVAPLEAGYSRILIQPRPGKLTSAEGKVPTTRGPVSVKYSATDKQFTMDVEIPLNTTARVGIPAGSGGKVWLDGKPVKDVEADSTGTLFIDVVVGGKHTIERKY